MKNKKCLCVLLSLFFLLPMMVSAQYQNTTGERQATSRDSNNRQNRSAASHWFTGGMIGGGFSSYSSYAQVSPIIGYKITPKWQVGTRLNYIFQSYKDSYGSRYNLHIYGASLFTRYLVFRSIFLQTEYELLSIPLYPYQGDRGSVNSLFVGGGFMQNLGGSGFATITILYNLLDSINSPYSNPLIRVGFGFGF